MGPKAKAVKFYSTVSDRAEVVHLIASLFNKDGGPGSGNHGHAGRPGKRGGSAPGKGGGSSSGGSDPKGVVNYSTKANFEPSSSLKEETLTPIEDPDFDIFEYIEQANKAYAEKGPEFQKKAEEVIKKLEESGKVRGVAKAARECGGDTRDFLEMMTPQNKAFLEFQHKEINTEETWPDYIKRIQMTLASEPKYLEAPDGIVDGINIVDSYEWDGSHHVDERFGQLIDTEIEAVIEKQGFNGTPRVMTKEDFDSYIKDNPQLPVMLRTFSAPNQEILDQYNKDLETGAWYVDCGIGGAKYGQGMYTAYAPQSHIVPVDSKYIDLDEERFPDEVIRGKDGRLWKYDPEHEYTSISKAPKGSAIFAGGDFFGGKAEVFEVKEPGKVLVDSTGEEYNFDVLRSYRENKIMKQLTEEEAKLPDYSRPLGQMRMYIELNESREKRNSTVSQEYEEKIRKLDEEATPSTGVYRGSVFTDLRPPKIVSVRTADGDMYLDVEETSTPVKDGDLDNLEPGYYMITYDHFLTGDKEMIPFRVTDNGERQGLESWYLESFDKRLQSRVVRNPELHKCTDITPEKPKEQGPATSVRKMTLDRSTNFVRFEDLENEFNRYQRDGYKSFKNIGSYAAARGYDAIVCSNYGKTIVVLNRTKLILSDENVEVPDREVS